MKYIIFLGLLIIPISQFGCEQTTEPEPSDIYVSYEIESAFQDDSVEMSLDKEVLLKSRVTTDYTISLAWSSGLQKLSRNNHKLHFAVVEYGAETDYLIDNTNDTSTVLLRFNKNINQISIKQIKGIYFRD